MSYSDVNLDVGEITFQQWFESMTAIGVVYTTAGFVIAADGRSSLSEDISIGTDGQQKIFRGRMGTAEVAWSLAGIVSNKDKSFSLIDEVAQAMDVANAADPQPRGCSPWLDIFSAHLRASVGRARNAGLIPPFTANMNMNTPNEAERNTFATVFVVEYFCNGRPSSVRIQIAHSDG